MDPTMDRNRLRHSPVRWAALAVLAALLVPAAAHAQAQASCMVGGSSLVDGVLNGAEGEDENFLGAKNVGLPQVVFVVDASPHMRKLPRDLDSAEVRGAIDFGATPADGSCTNTILDALTYRANACVDGKGNKKGGANCNLVTGLPDGWDLPYRRDASGSSNGQQYWPYDPSFTGLFDNTKYYVYDRGWGVNSGVVDAAWTGTASEMCTKVGLADPVSSIHLKCVSCVQTKGYWLPPDPVAPATTPAYRPVLSGNWLNFYPPKYVIARRVLKDQFAAMDYPSRKRQAMLTTVVGTDRRCFSDNTAGVRLDTLMDGAETIGNPTKFKPPCDQFLGCGHNGSLGGGRAAFDNAVNGKTELFTSPPAAACPVVVGALPGDAPVGAASLSFAAGTDGVCRGTYLNASAQPLQEAVCAPYAEAVFNAGQYLADPALYTGLFTPAGMWTKADLMDVNGTCPAANCGCPKPTIILIAGGAPDFDDNLPCQITGTGCASIVPPVTSGEGVSCGAVNATGNLAKVTRFLATRNTQPNRTYSVPQVTIGTFVIGIGTRDAALIAGAEAGNGQFIEAEDATSLRSAINEALNMITSAEISFSNVNVTTVQTASNSGLIVPRFQPRKKPFWPGKLMLFEMASEGGAGCTTGGMSDPYDFNKDGDCDDVFFRDTTSFIVSGADGVFKKATLSGTNFVATATAATPFWEASQQIPADGVRKIYTVIDRNNDGYFDYTDAESGGQIEFTVANAAQIAPYLNLSTDFCTRLGSKLGGACLAPQACAEAVIKYVRGVDIFDEDCDTNRLEARAERLGDIFHSSPVVVEPPMPTKSPVCRLGLSTQCLVSLTEAEGTLDGEDEYGEYLKQSITIDGRTMATRRRDKVILVGANDGMLHAFDYGVWGKDNPATAEVNECPDEANGICPGYFTKGTGKELWAFIPPDLLPKLQRLFEGRHQFYVDGSPMVRDVWVDLDTDFHKDRNEFKTVAIVGERRGGVHYFALDVSHPREPQFRWLFPQPNTVLARASGETFTDFLPTAPPVGPLRLRNDASPNSHEGVKFEERWVTFLSGGFDQVHVRGRMVNVVDVWYGGGGPGQKATALWTWRPSTEGNDDDDDDDGEESEDRFSFATTAGLIAYGKGPRADSNSNGYYFDTATLGDAGGQLWTLRFNHPDRSRWAGGLSFRSSDSTQCSRQPFFQVTSNVVSYEDGRLQTLVGTGDRFNLRDRNGGECSEQNLLACVRRGCRLEIQQKMEVCDQKLEFKRKYDGPNLANYCDIDDDVSISPNISGNCCDKKITGEAKYKLRCINSDLTLVDIEWDKKVVCEREDKDACGADASTFNCKIEKETPFDICSNFDRCADPQIVSWFPVVPRNSFYSVKTLDPMNPARDAFNSPTDAATYTAAHPTRSSLTSVDPYTPSAAFATDASPGWYLDYRAPAGRTFPVGFPVSATMTYSERTASQAVVFGGCSFFSSFMPNPSSTTCGTDNSQQGLTTRYTLDYKRGDACTGLNPELATSRYGSSSSGLPEAPDQLMLTIRPDGVVSVGVASMPREGGKSSSVTEVTEGSGEPAATYTLGIDRGLHECRHPPGASPEDYAGQRTFVTTNGSCLP